MPRCGLRNPPRFSSPAFPSPAKDRAHPRIWRRPRARRRVLCGGARRQRSLGAAKRRDAGPRVRPERDHHGPGNARARARAAGARHRHRSWSPWAAAGWSQASLPGTLAAVKVIGVEPEASPTLTKALEAGHPVEAEVGGLAADSLAPRQVGKIGVPDRAEKYAPRTVLVTDDSDRRSRRRSCGAPCGSWRKPGGACAFSAITSGAYRPAAGERVAVVISGGEARRRSISDAR